MTSKFIPLIDVKEKIDFKLLKKKFQESNIEKTKNTKKAFIYLFISILLSISSFFFAFISLKNGFLAIFTPAVIFFTGFFKFWHVLIKKVEVNGIFRDLFISKVIDKIIPGSYYHPMDSNLQNSFSYSNLFDYSTMMTVNNDGAFDLDILGNRVSLGAMIGKHIRRGSTDTRSYDTFFAGTFASMKLNEKRSPFIISNCKIKTTPIKKIKLNDNNFDNNFKIWSDDIDDIKRILSDEFIEYLLKLDKTFEQIAISISGNELLIGVNIYTNVLLEKSNPEEYLDRFYNHFKKVYDIFEKLISFSIS